MLEARGATPGGCGAAFFLRLLVIVLVVAGVDPAVGGTRDLLPTVWEANGSSLVCLGEVFFAGGDFFSGVDFVDSGDVDFVFFSGGVFTLPNLPGSPVYLKQKLNVPRLCFTN